MRPHAAGETLLPEKSGRQNLAALGTTTGQNLAAVGSSHSLTETVNLGTVAAAGLVGTLHSDTPPMMKFYAQYRTYRHSNPFLGTNTVVPMYYNRKATVGQPSFFLFFQGSCPKIPSPKITVCAALRPGARWGRILHKEAQSCSDVDRFGIKKALIFVKTVVLCKESIQIS
jgi:hypothetical protein